MKKHESDLLRTISQRQEETVIPMIESLDKKFALLSEEIGALNTWKLKTQERFKFFYGAAVVIGGAVVWAGERAWEFFIKLR